MQAFQLAWQATCHAEGQNRLYIPAGRFLVSTIYFEGPCLAPNPITIQVVGTVLASNDFSDYVNGEWLMFQKINGLKIIGGGVFDGQGQQSWNYVENCETSKQNCQRMPSVSFVENNANECEKNSPKLNSNVVTEVFIIGRNHSPITLRF